MPTIELDKTLNSDLGAQLAKVETAINNGLSGTDPSVTTLTTSGLATAGSVKVDTGTKTATATAGAATLAKSAGKVTSESLTTAAGAEYTLTITATGKVAAADQVFASLANGTNTQGVPAILRVTPTADTITVVVRNLHASQALNGTLVVSYMVCKN